MKTHNNLYNDLCSYENLEKAFKKAKKGKSEKYYVIEFAKNLKENLLQIEKELQNFTYQPEPLETFILRDPKTRKISVSKFKDRIVHHAICNIIEPIFDKRFIYDSYANRKFKGVHAALKRFDRWKRKVTRNGKRVGNAKNNNKVVGYVLKADIKHYFETVDREILMKIINKKIADKNVLWLIKQIINNHSTEINGKGMPLGNLTSQFFANIYLNELDQFVKHKLKVKHYLRYVDDFVIIHRSKQILFAYKEAIDHFLREELKLELHPNKCKIFQLYKGAGLLGFRVFYHFKLLRKRNISDLMRRLEQFKEDYKQGTISKEYILESMHGWNAHASTANTYNLRTKINNKVELIFNT